MLSGSHKGEVRNCVSRAVDVTHTSVPALPFLVNKEVWTVAVFCFNIFASAPASYFSWGWGWGWGWGGGKLKSVETPRGLIFPHVHSTPRVSVHPVLPVRGAGGQGAKINECLRCVQIAGVGGGGYGGLQV